jgi:7,8-dihydropterin-6-yl-methyl-4-(beta-D-ribofuranosyl)aminobenzene 5'-phosphate synthase
MSAIILALVVFLILVFLLPVFRLGVTRKRRLLAAHENIQPAIKASNERFSQIQKSTFQTKVTVLVENHKDQSLTELVAEHGLSFHIQQDGKSVLFDTGATGAAIQNAREMGLDLSGVDAVVVSHGHRDHGGGLGTFFEENGHALVYLGKGAAIRRYSPLFWFWKIPIGLNGKLIKANRERFRFVESTTRIAGGLTIITDLSGTHPAPADRGTLLKRQKGQLVADDFTDEIALVIQNRDGLVVLSGCGHNGVLNLLDRVKSVFPEVPVRAVLGGFHLMNPRLVELSESQSQIERLAQSLLDSGVERFITGHCTGVDAYWILKGVMKDRLEYLSTGSRIVF